MRLLLKRIVWGYRMRVWPWRVPIEAARYLPFRIKLTQADIKRGLELALIHGWKLK